MSDEQGGLCAICRTAPAEHVDHDHVTGRVRQLLCFNCNGGLGQFKDDPAVLRAAASYVERHRTGGARVDVVPRPRLGRSSSRPRTLRHREAGRWNDPRPTAVIARERLTRLTRLMVHVDRSSAR